MGNNILKASLPGGVKVTREFFDYLQVFDMTTDFDYKMDTISIENLKKIGL